MANDLTKKNDNTPVPSGSTVLLPITDMRDLALEILSDVNQTRKEALEMYNIFRNLLTNEGEGSSATKEQIASLLQVALEADTKKIKILEMCMKAQKDSPTSGDKVTNQQNNYFCGSRRDMIEAIDQIIEVDGSSVKVGDKDNDG